MFSDFHLFSYVFLNCFRISCFFPDFLQAVKGAFSYFQVFWQFVCCIIGLDWWFRCFFCGCSRALLFVRGDGPFLFFFRSAPFPHPGSRQLWPTRRGTLPTKWGLRVPYQVLAQARVGSSPFGLPLFSSLVCCKALFNLSCSPACLRGKGQKKSAGPSRAVRRQPVQPMNIPPSHGFC